MDWKTSCDEHILYEEPTHPGIMIINWAANTGVII